MANRNSYFNSSIKSFYFNFSLPALMATAASQFPQVYQNLPVFPGMPPPSFDMAKRSAFTPPLTVQSHIHHKNQPPAVYSQAELDMLLYGYGISKSSDGANHALSGLRISEFGTYMYMYMYVWLKSSSGQCPSHNAMS